MRARQVEDSHFGVARGREEARLVVRGPLDREDVGPVAWPGAGVVGSATIAIRMEACEAVETAD